MIDGLELKMFSRVEGFEFRNECFLYKGFFYFLLGNNYDCLDCSMNLHK
jgi:hypothetical protein